MLRWRGAVIKRLLRHAPDQEAVLKLLERRGWPGWIGDPVDAAADEDAMQRRRNTAGNLNRGLTKIHFGTDGQGTGYRWWVVT